MEEVGSKMTVLIRLAWNPILAGLYHVLLVWNRAIPYIIGLEFGYFMHLRPEIGLFHLSPVWNRVRAFGKLLRFYNNVGKCRLTDSLSFP